MSFCTKCGCEFNVGNLDGKDLVMTSEQNIIDENNSIVGCRYCLGSFIKEYSTLVERMSVRGGMLILELRKKESSNFSSCGDVLLKTCPQLMSNRPVKMFVWPRY